MDPLLALIIFAGVILILWIGWLFLRRAREREWQAGLLALPESERQEKLAAQERKTAFGCLSFYMLLVMFANLGVAILEFAAATNAKTPDIKTLNLVSGGIDILVVICAGVVYWGHRRWAIYALLGIIGVSMLINLAARNVLGVIQGVLPIVILYAAVRPVWKMME